MRTTMRLRHRRLTAVLVAAAVSGPAAPLAAAPASAAVLPNVGVSAYAYGAYATVGGTVTSGPLAYSGIGCTTTFGRSVSGTSAAADARPFGSVGATTSTASSSVENGYKVSRTTARTGAVNLLGGLVRTDAVTSASTATVNSAVTYSGGNRSELVGLRVGGVAQSATPAPNSSLQLRGSDGRAYATVYLNRQTKAWVGSDWRVQTVALQVVVTGANPFGLKLGSNVLVGVSSSALTRPVLGLVGGTGYATSATLADGRVASSPTAVVHPGCTTGGSSSNVAGATVPGLVTTGTTQSTATASTSPTSRSVAVKATIGSPSVLLGLISASSLTADTGVSQTGSLAPVVRDSSRFVGLRVTGFPAIDDAVPPNTVVTVPQLGRVTFHKVTRSASGIQVVMVEVVLSQAVAGLPTGSVVRIGYSDSRLL